MCCVWFVCLWRDNWISVLYTLKGFTEFGSISRGLLPYQAVLSFWKVVLIVDSHLHVSKWMQRRLPSQSRLYFLITCWWWLVARGRGMDGRPKECRSHLSHYEIPTWTATYIVCSDGSQGCVQDWSNDFMYFLVTHYKCTLTNESLPTQPYLLCVLPIWFSLIYSHPTILGEDWNSSLCNSFYSLQV